MERWKTSKRPYTILNAAMTLDGKIATRSGEAEISSFEDKKRVHRLRANVDAVLVGVNTILIDDPKLTVKYAKGRNPVRVVVDTDARIPLNARVLDTKVARTMIAVSEGATRERVAKLKEMGVDVLYCGSAEEVDLIELMKTLKESRISTLLLEGGGNLNWSMLKQGLVDEVRIAIAPKIVGGKDTVTLVEGDGVEKMDDAFKLRLRKRRRYGECLVLFYDVLSRKPIE